MDKTVARRGMTVTFPMSNDRAVLEQSAIITVGSEKCQHRLASMHNSRKAADCLDFTFAEVAHLVGIESLPGIVLDEPDARQHL